MFTLHKTHPSGARRGSLKTAHGIVETPFFLPIATKGVVKTISGPELYALEQQIDTETEPVVLSNTYHLYLKPGLELLKLVGGLHQFMNWNGAMVTDSGGFQVFSLAKLRTLNDNGVEFQSHLDGSKHVFSPERSMEIQSIIGADIWMAFDYFPGYPAQREDAEYSVELTTQWAKRCAAWETEYSKNNSLKQHALFGIVQGSTFEDLRTQSATELTALNLPGYAIGGLAVGEPPEEMYRIIEMTTPQLPQQKPRYVMGVGPPEQILESVKRGIDMFDCVIPSRNARHGSLFVHTQERIVDPSLSAVEYEKINITAEIWKDDLRSVDQHCPCSTCTSGLSRAYIRHLFSLAEPLALRLATVHNISFYMQLMKEIRNAI